MIPEIEIKPIKFQNHQKKDEKLEEFIYRTNDILYFFSRKIISPKAKEYMLTNFEEIGRKVSELEDTPRKEELLIALRHYYKLLRDTECSIDVMDDVEQYQKLIQFEIARSIKTKQGDTSDIIKQLEENKMVDTLYVKPFQALSTKRYRLYVDNFYQINGELLSMIGKKFTLK